MANNFSKVDWVCMDTLRLLKHKLGIVSVFRPDYQKDFTQEFAIGQTARVKYPWRPTLRDGLGYVGGNIERIETTITVDQVIGSDYDYGTVDKLLNMERGEEKVRKEYNEPMAAYIAAELDRRAAQFAAQNANAIAGVLGTNPTTFDATSAAARENMGQLDCPASGDRELFVPYAVSRAIKGGTDANLSRFGILDDIKRLYRKGYLGEADGFEWTESNSLYTHTAGTWAGAVTLSSAVANGATSIAVTCTTGDTFLKGDKIGIGSVYPVNPVTRVAAQKSRTYNVTVAQDTTGVASAATIPINETIYFTGPYQNVDSQPANGATLTLWPGTASPNGKSGKIGLALHTDAFGFVGLPLPMPKKEEVVGEAYDEETGLWLGFIRAFDPRSRSWINRMDSGLFGFGRLHVEPCAVAVACA